MRKGDIQMNVCLTQKKDGKCWYAKLQWKDEVGNWKSKCVSTGIPTQGNNKRKAKKKAEEIRDEYEAYMLKERNKIHLFTEYMLQWIEEHKRNIRASTYQSYKQSIEKVIIPYFVDKKIYLSELTTKDIQDFYNYILDSGKSANTVKHYHSYINKALKVAVLQGKIERNPCNYIQLPKKKKYEAKAFTVQQMSKIIEISKDTPIEIPVLLASYCGLRRSEVLGLEWSAIDLDNSILHVRKTRVCCVHETFEENTKSETSRRDIPIPSNLKAALLKEKDKQLENRKLFGNSYIDNDFVCVWDDGKPLSCNYVSKKFHKILNQLNYTGYSFHSLRHTVGTMMANQNINLKTVQDFLGHSDITTTQIYLHPDWQAKQKAANVISDMLNF